MDLLSRIHHNENGADEGINKLAILALVAIPLIITIAVFGKAIVERASDAWGNLTGAAVEPGTAN